MKQLYLTITIPYAPQKSKYHNNARSLLFGFVQGRRAPNNGKTTAQRDEKHRYETIFSKTDGFCENSLSQGARGPAKVSQAGRDRPTDWSPWRAKQMEQKRCRPGGPFENKL